MKQKICQSCGMPMDKDPGNGGTEKDGAKNETYCSYCYHDGEFTFTGTVKEMQEHCRQMMIKSGMPKITAWLFSRGLSRLDRWKRA